MSITEQQSRARSTDYLDRAAKMRQLALNTQYPDVRMRLLMMATSFERLADQVEKWDDAGFAAAAAD